MIKILNQYPFGQDVTDISPFGNGNINKTYLISTNSNKKYILQEINSKVFKKPKEVMRNIELVTEHIRNIHRKNSIESDQAVLEILYTNDNQSYVKLDDRYWRAYNFVENAITYETTDDPEIFKQVGIAVGAFQKFLNDFNSDRLAITIPDFHNTPKRFSSLSKVVDEDNYDRVMKVFKEIQFINSRKNKLSIIVQALEKKEIPLRVTHNDTKLNNVMIDKTTNKAVCIIDLDTVMPGSVLYDFGDAIRVGANNAKEDESDLSKVRLNMSLFESFVDGFLEETHNILNQKEIDLLVDSVWLITMEISIRFLTDYLDNDQYFRTDYPEHNLVRTKAQLKLVNEIERYYEQMKNYIKNKVSKM